MQADTVEPTTGGGRYLEALREHWPYILGTVVLAVVAASLYVRAAEERYRAEADVLVTPVSGDTLLGIPVLREDGVSRSVVTAARLVKTPSVADRVRRELELPLGVQRVRGLVDVTPQEQSNVLTIGAESSSPDQAARIANAFAAALVTERSEEFQDAVRAAVARLSSRLESLPAARRATAEAGALSERLGDLQQLAGGRDPTIRVVSAAVAPSSPTWPRPVLTLIVAVVAGVLVGMGLAVAIELLNPLVLRERELSRGGYGLPVLARMPPMSNRDAADILSGRRTLTPDAQRALKRIAVAALGRPSRRRGPKTVQITSAGTGEGRSVASVGLAALLASAGRSVALFDGDERERGAEGESEKK